MIIVRSTVWGGWAWKFSHHPWQFQWFMSIDDALAAAWRMHPNAPTLIYPRCHK